ncbi:hypothetical protein HK102_008557, partial [Quaeritorhiza haematococci]
MADSIKALFPAWDLLAIKVSCVALVAISTFPKSLGVLSYASIVGIVATLNLVALVVYDGATTTETPGSLIYPAETSFWPRSWKNVPLTIGLVIVGLDGHAVFPAIYRDLKAPRKNYPRVANTTYASVAFIYLFVAACGYLMFGDMTRPEITQNLPTVASYNRFLTHATLWLVAINPATKYALVVSPVNANIESTLSIQRTLPRLISRTLLSTAVLSVSILFPSFHRIMGLLGSSFSFVVSVVFPLCCYVKIFGFGPDKGSAGL